MPIGVERPDWTGPEMSAEEITGREIVPGDPPIPESARFDGEAYVAEVEARHTGLPSQSGGSLPADVLAEWEATGGVEHHTQQLEAAGAAILSDMPERAGFEAGLYGLPHGARKAIARVLALGINRRRPEATIDTMEDLMSPQDQDAAVAWLESLSPEQKRAIMKGLSG